MPFANDMDVPQFFSADLCKAGGIDAATLKNWIAREPPAIHLSDHDRRAFGSGRPHLFTYRRVLLAAICAELVALGLPPRRAGSLARNFTDLGEGGQGIKKRRAAGEMFATGATVILAYPHPSKDNPEMWISYVVNVTADTPLQTLFAPKGGGLKSSAVVVDVSAIDRRIREILNVPGKN